MNRENLGRLLILSAGTLWSLGGVLIKMVRLSTPAISCFRSLFAALAILPFLRGRLKTLSWDRTGGDTTSSAASRALSCFSTLPVAVLAYVSVMATFVAATRMTFAANAIILQHTAPLFVFLLSIPFAGNFLARGQGQVRSEKRSIPALVGCMIGIAIIFVGQARSVHLAGISIGLASGFSFGLYMVCASRLRNANPLAVIFVVNAVSALLLAPFVRLPGLISGSQIILLVVLGTVQLGIPYVLFNHGLKSVRVQEAALIVMVEPLLNPLWVALKLGEIPPVTTFLGGAFILVSLALRFLLYRPAPGNGSGNDGQP